MPIFDYCSTLLIYYSDQAIQKLANSYYLCIFKLFKLSFNSDNYELVNLELKKFGIFNLHHRIVKKLSIFVYKINIFQNPPNLKNELKFNFERKVPYNLRNSKNLSMPRTERKFGEQTFGYFFTKFINILFIEKICDKTSFKDFKIFINKTLDHCVSKALDQFKKLNFYIKYFYFFI